MPVSSELWYMKNKGIVTPWFILGNTYSSRKHIFLNINSNVSLKQFLLKSNEIFVLLIEISFNHVSNKTTLGDFTIGKMVKCHGYRAKRNSLNLSWAQWIRHILRHLYPFCFISQITKIFYISIRDHIYILILSWQPVWCK